MPSQAKESLADKILEVAVEQIATSGWSAVNMSVIAEQLHTTIDRVYEVYPSKLYILGDFIRKLDQQTLANIEKFVEDETTKDRLFAVIMARFDACAEYKGAISNLRRDALKDPALAMCIMPYGLNSMIWLLEAAGLKVDGILGIIRAKIFAAFYLYLVGIWLADETTDMSTTMAAVDRSLDRILQIPGFS